MFTTNTITQDYIPSLISCKLYHMLANQRPWDTLWVRAVNVPVSKFEILSCSYGFHSIILLFHIKTLLSSIPYGFNCSKKLSSESATFSNMTSALFTCLQLTPETNIQPNVLTIHRPARVREMSKDRKSQVNFYKAIFGVGWFRGWGEGRVGGRLTGCVNLCAVRSLT